MSKMDLDEIAIRNSTWAWNKLRIARNLDFQLGEESLTDFIVLNIKKWGAGKIAIDTFTRHAESINGSDWEWWFTGPSGKWLGMRVQAKVLNLSSEKYEHLHHRNRHGYQVDTLINDAHKNGLIPIYCMYTNWDPKKYKPTWKCKTFSPTVRHYGTSILDPRFVKSLQPKNETRLSSIIGSLKPMHCIFCCTGFGGIELPDRALNWLSGAGLITDDGELSVIQDVDYLRSEAPYYVYQMIEGQLGDDLIDIDDDRLSRVTVFRELNVE
jgi:hypothetical protein